MTHVLMFDACVRLDCIFRMDVLLLVRLTDILTEHISTACSILTVQQAQGFPPKILAHIHETCQTLNP